MVWEEEKAEGELQSYTPQIRLSDFSIFSVDRETEKRQNKVLHVGRCVRR